MPEYEFMDKALFFPEKAILVIGDLHIGYEESLVESGILLPEQQLTEVIESLKKIMEEIETKNQKVKKVIFLGDIKHFFGYEQKEKANFQLVLDFLQEYVSEKDIVLIKGNHDTMDYSYGKMKDYYVDGDIAFVHGHVSFPEIYGNNIRTVVSGHLHPSVILEEKPGVKKENYKCFLEGVSGKKTFLVLPSFLDFYEGTPVNYYRDDFLESFSIIPRKDILKFRVKVIEDATAKSEAKVYDFGIVKDME